MKKHCFIYSLLLFFLININATAQCGDKGSIVISEIYFDTHYSEDIATKYHHFGEYIELFNSSNEAINLRDWVIKDNHTEFKFVIGTLNSADNLIIQPGGIKIIAFYGWYKAPHDQAGWYDLPHQGFPSEIGSREKFIELFPQATGHINDIILQNRIILYNNTDKVSLYNPLGRLIHEVSYYNGGHANGSQSGALNYMKINEFSIDDGQTGVHISNFGGGVFNGPIGVVAQLDPVTGNPIINPVTGNPYTFQSGLYQTSIYLTDENAYYFEKPKVIQIGQATPFSIPYTIQLLPVSLDLFSAPVTGGFNWIHNVSYDITSTSNEKLGESRTYFDDSAKPIVSLSKDFQNNVTWASETTYDSFGRQFQTSFPAIVCNANFDKIDVLSNPAHKSAYLDYYYGDTNTFNEFQATAEYPFTEVEYDKLNPGNTIRAYGGNRIETAPDIFEWKTGYSFSMPAAQEMYYAFGHNYYNGTITSGLEEVITKFYKTVTVDPHGVESVVFTDGEGKTLAAARSTGSSVSYPVISTIGTQGFVDVYIPSGMPAGTFIGGPSLYKVYNLKTGEPIPTPANLPPGNAYRVETITTPTVNYKTYINTSTGAIQAEAGAKGVQYRVNYYDYTLNYYDKTNRLYKTTQPNGFDVTCINANQVKAVPNHTFATTFTYNTLGQLITSTSPDEGTSKFAYRKDGQIRFSQNQEQTLANKISYTNYDQFARPIESGVITAGYAWNTAIANADNPLPTSGITYSDRTFSVYDFVGNYTSGSAPFMGLSDFISSAGLDPNDYIQHNLAGSVVETYNDNSRTWYSYDLYGRVEWMAQNIQGLGLKRVHYEYDARGQIKKVIYQKGNTAEQFVHRYTYDFNGALTKVETSTNNITFETHADYEYYIDGKLKRVELAGGIQGMDYVYTLGGMLKSINHPSLTAAKDPGGDSNDVFGITLDYYSGDYIRPGKPQFESAPSVAGINQDQYNGNIKAIRWANKQLDSSGTAPKAYAYKYNTNSWLNSAYFGNYNNLTNTISANSQFFEGNITYDANGNIKTLQRKNNASVLFDNFTYNYTSGKNQLARVADTAGSATMTDDIDNQTATNNYMYNQIGQLTQNVSEGLTYFYNVQGLTTEVRKAGLPVVKFYYNERGERIKKESFSGGSLQSTDYYVLDASGNTLGIYNKFGTTTTLSEQPVYGAGRLGVFNRLDSSTNYQITDHLGNVRAVIKKVGTAPALQQWADYYPFGEQLPTRNSYNNYRYAYQGQELDRNTGMEAFKLRLWDGRIGRWLNPDPYGQHFSPYLGMGNNPISSIDPDGGWRTWFGAFWYKLWNGGEIYKSPFLGDYGVRSYSQTINYTDADGNPVVQASRIEFGGKRHDMIKYYNEKPYSIPSAAGLSLPLNIKTDSKDPTAGLPDVYFEGNVSLNYGSFGGDVRFLGTKVALKGEFAKTSVIQLGFDVDTSRGHNNVFKNTSGINGIANTTASWEVAKFIGHSRTYNLKDGSLLSTTTSGLISEFTTEYTHGEVVRNKVGLNVGASASFFIGVDATFKVGLIMPPIK